MFENTLSWPKKGERIFPSALEPRTLHIGGDELRVDACPRPLPDMEWARRCDDAPRRYEYGYREAANLICRELISTSNEILVFPYILMWRHHIELTIKRLTLLIREYHGTLADARIPKKHVLPKLWEPLRELLEKDSSATVELREPIEAAECIIKELEEVDPNAEHSRYAEGVTSEYLIKSFSKLPRYFEPAHAHGVLTRLSDFFHCLDLHYSEKLKTKQESRHDDH